MTIFDLRNHSTVRIAAPTPDQGEPIVRSPHPASHTARPEYLACDSSSNSSSAPECTNLIQKYNAIFRAATTNRNGAADGKILEIER